MFQIYQNIYTIHLNLKRFTIAMETCQRTKQVSNRL